MWHINRSYFNLSFTISKLLTTPRLYILQLLTPRSPVTSLNSDNKGGANKPRAHTHTKRNCNSRDKKYLELHEVFHTRSQLRRKVWNSCKFSPTPSKIFAILTGPLKLEERRREVAWFLIGWGPEWARAVVSMNESHTFTRSGVRRPTSKRKRCEGLVMLTVVGSLWALREELSLRKQVV